MKVEFVYRAVRGNIFILPFLTIFFGIGFQSNAQGWKFTAKVQQRGSCGNFTLPDMPLIPVDGFQTQTQCDNARRSYLNFAKSYPVYDSKGNFSGDCTVYIYCTECVGKNTAPAAQADPSSNTESKTNPSPSNKDEDNLDLSKKSNDQTDQNKTAITDDLSGDLKKILPQSEQNSNGDASKTAKELLQEKIKSNKDSEGVLTAHGYNDNLNVPLPAMNSITDGNIKGMTQPFIKIGQDLLNGSASFIYTPDWEDKEKNNHPVLEGLRGLAIIVDGFFPPGVKYGAIFTTDLVFKDIEAGNDVYNGKTTSTSQICLNTLKQTEFDMASQKAGDIALGYAASKIGEMAPGIGNMIEQSFNPIAKNVGEIFGSLAGRSGIIIGQMITGHTGAMVGAGQGVKDILNDVNHTNDDDNHPPGY
jgi:hypothetical protein